MGKFWTKDEIKLLRKYAPIAETDARKIARQLKRSAQSVKQKAMRMGLKELSTRSTFWTKEEVKLLKKIFPNRKTKDVAIKLNRSTNSVREKAHRLGLTKPKKYRYWSKKETKLLGELLADYKIDQISIHLDRSANSVAGKAMQLGFGARERL